MLAIDFDYRDLYVFRAGLRRISGTGIIVSAYGPYALAGVEAAAPTALAYAKASSKSVVAGAGVNAILGKDYKASDLLYNASLGLVMDKKTGLMVKWAENTSPWVINYIKLHGVFANYP